MRLMLALRLKELLTFGLTLPIPYLIENSFSDMQMPPLPGMIVNLPVRICSALPVGIGRVREKISDVGVVTAVRGARSLDHLIDVLVVPPGADANEGTAFGTHGRRQLIIGVPKTRDMATEWRIVTQFQDDNRSGADIIR